MYISLAGDIMHMYIVDVVRGSMDSKLVYVWEVYSTTMGIINVLLHVHVGLYDAIVFGCGSGNISAKVSSPLLAFVEKNSSIIQDYCWKNLV